MRIVGPESEYMDGFKAAAQTDAHEFRRLDAEIVDLKRALVLARCGLAEALEATVRRGSHVHWDILEQQLRTAHDATHQALQPEKL